MGITSEYVERYAATVYIARCDDCDAALFVASNMDALTRRLAQWRPDWREGLPIFCPEFAQAACAERAWQRYGRHMQRVIDSMAEGS